MKLNLFSPTLDKDLSRFGLFFLKLAIIIYAVWFLSEKKQWEHFSKIIENGFPFYLWGLLSLSIMNWVLEIKKWQKLVSTIRPIGFKEALRQSLISFAASLFTPNRIGEYGIKILYFPKNIRRKIFFLNLAGNLWQLVATVFFGLLAIGFTFLYHPKIFHSFPLDINTTILWGLLILIVSSSFFIYKTKRWKLCKKKNLPFLTIAGLSFSRYLIFSTQFLLFWMIFHQQNFDWHIYTGIFLTYLISSALPVLSMMDWAIKGSIAIWIFHLFGFPSHNMIFVTSFMWVFNFAVPFFLGLIFFFYQQKNKSNA